MRRINTNIVYHIDQWFPRITCKRDVSAFTLGTSTPSLCSGESETPEKTLLIGLKMKVAPWRGPSASVSVSSLSLHLCLPLPLCHFQFLKNWKENFLSYNTLWLHFPFPPGPPRCFRTPYPGSHTLSPSHYSANRRDELLCWLSLDASLPWGPVVG